MTRLFLTAALTLTGCGAVAVGCDFRDGSVNGPEARCQERTGIQAPAFGPACDALDATVVDGGCPLDGRAGGCRLGGDVAGGAVVDWYYAPETPGSVEAICEGEGTEFIPAD